jgi:hypothetical protein
MSTLIDIYTWRSLTTAINKILPIHTFALDNIFKRKTTHLTDKVDFEFITGKQKLARFVNKGEEAQLIEKTNRTIKTFSLPRIFEKKVFDADELASFKHAGSSYISSSNDLTSAANERILTELLDLKNRVIRRSEQLAMAGLATGGFTVTQDNISFSYDWGFITDKHKITLTGAAKWDQTTAKIIENIRLWKNMVFKATGNNPTMGLLGSGASNLLLSDAKVTAMMDRKRIQTGELDITRPFYNGATFLGHWMGIDWYEYINTYVDDNDVEQEMLATNACVLYYPSDSFRIHNGPIIRIQPDGTRLNIMDNMVVTPLVSLDGTSVQWSCETKPLPVVHNPDDIISVIVA